MIPFYISLSLLAPELRIGLRCNPAKTTIVRVPVAAMNKNDLLKSRKHEIGFPGKILSMQTETITQAVGHAAHDKLGLRVLALDRCHATTTLLRCQYVCHETGVSESRMYYCGSD